MMRQKYTGFTLIEALVASAIGAIVITSASATVGNIFANQRRVEFSSDFYSEARLLMERMAQIGRNNTLDYDRYFIEYGPPVLANTCTTFDSAQLPNGHTHPGAGTPVDNDRANRISLGYSTIFYWDTNADSTPDRNLGGKKVVGTTVADDDCTKAWDEATAITELYTINGSRNARFAIRKTAGGRVELQKQLGADTNGDRIADIWGPAEDGSVSVLFQGGQCIIRNDPSGTPTDYAFIGNAEDENLCESAHLYTPISPNDLETTALTFVPAPNRDPYLNFRVNAAQVHPQAYIALSVRLRNPGAAGFLDSNKPEITLQTTVSSRVYGDIRK